MIVDLLAGNQKKRWFFIHIMIGLFCILFSQAIIIWFYLFFISSINKIVSDYILRDSTKYIIPLVIYLSSFEVFGRMLGAGPFIPWELSKYLFLLTFIFYFLILKIKLKSYIGLFLLFILIPGSLIDISNKVTFELLVFNLLGPISISMLIMLLNKSRIKENDFSSYLRLIWYSSLSMLVYVVIKTPDLSDINFSLDANFQTSAGFGSNQVSTVIGIGMFLSFYAWMNKILFSGWHRIDGLSIALFAYQGFLTFSRGGMVIAFICMLIYYFLLINSENYVQFIFQREIKPIRFFGLSLLFVISAYLIINFISEGNITYRYLGETSTTLSGEKIKTFDTVTTGRYEIVKSDLGLWLNNFIFGTGVGSSKFLRDGGQAGIASHTEFSRLLSEHGLFGLVFIFLLIYIFMKKYFQNRNTVENALMTVLFLIGIGTMLHSGVRTFVSPLFIALSTMIVVDKSKNTIKEG